MACWVRFMILIVSCEFQPCRHPLMWATMMCPELICATLRVHGTTILQLRWGWTFLLKMLSLRWVAQQEYGTLQSRKTLQALIFKSRFVQKLHATHTRLWVLCVLLVRKPLCTTLSNCASSRIYDATISRRIALRLAFFSFLVETFSDSFYFLCFPLMRIPSSNPCMPIVALSH